MKMNHFFLSAFPVFLILALAGAQPHHGPQGGPRFQSPPNGEVEKKVDHHLLLRLSEELSLPEDKLIRMGEIFKQRREKCGRIQDTMRKTLDTLGLLARDSASSNETIGRLLARLKEQQSALFEAEQAKTKALESVLAPRQLAQYFILERDFRHQIMRMIRKESKDGGPGGTK